MSRNLFFSVGEPSGDHHAARVISHLRGIRPDVKVRGFGGPAMAAAGAGLDLDLTEHAVVGLVEVLPKLRQFFAFADQAETHFRRGDVDRVVLVDFPGFNWHIAKRAKKHGIPVTYFCPPQLWAWGGWRIRKLRRTVDHVLSVLPIEQRYYDSHGVPNTYIGHPFFDAVNEHRLDDATMQSLVARRNAGRRLVAVLPGSRTAEVQKNFPLQIRAVDRLRRQHPDVDFLVACHRDRLALAVRNMIRKYDPSLPMSVFVNRTSEIIEACESAMMVSGSVSLELMARGKPAAVIYHVSRSLHAIARRMVKLDSITLPNLLAGRRVYPEFVSVGGPHPGVDFLERSMHSFLADDFYRRQTVDQIERLRREYCRPGASAAAAQYLSDRLPITMAGLEDTLPETQATPLRRAA